MKHVNSELYTANGLVFWEEQDLILRESFEKQIVGVVKSNLAQQNSAFQFFKVEAPLITPSTLLNPNYSAADVYRLDEGFTLRPETTPGSYVYLQHILNTHNARKVRLPVVVYQHGKSFRREQDQATKYMRLKEFYQLELQIAFSATTATDYLKWLLPTVKSTIEGFIGECVVETSDRLPSYSTETTDIVRAQNSMEVCSISRRTDFEGAKILEVAIGTDRIVYNTKLHRNARLSENE